MKERIKIFVFAFFMVIFSVGCSFGAVVFDIPDDDTPNLQKNFVENDPKLPPYDNPIEFDVADGQLHVSFKGAFRGEGERKDLIICVRCNTETRYGN